MELPYTVEVLFDTMSAYNRATFPAAAVAVVLAGATVALTARPPASRPRPSDRLIGGTLAAGWLWVGWAHQLGTMATLNFLAPVYGVGWLIEGLLLALVATGLGKLRFDADGAAGRLGLALALLGAVGYPLAVLALGYDWRALPLAGTAPNPTAMFTAGLLLLARGRLWLKLLLLAIPLAWAGVAAATAHLLGFPLDFAVPAVVLIALAGTLATPGRGRAAT